jgi:hypothetical protein
MFAQVTLSNYSRSDSSPKLTRYVFDLLAGELSLLFLHISCACLSVVNDEIDSCCYASKWMLFVSVSILPP